MAGRKLQERRVRVVVPRNTKIGHPTRAVATCFVAVLLGTAVAVLTIEPRAASTETVACGAAFGRTELFFGSARPDGSVVTDEEFGTFVDAEVAPRFPDGLTLLVGHGQFKNGVGSVVRERSFVLILLHPGPNPAGSAGVEAIRRAYKARFAQDSVLRVDSQTTRVCF
jgi:hypothetical protein